MPEPRGAVQRMRPYHPPTGGRRERVRLDFNENTIGCAPGVADALRAAIERDLLATYPDYEAIRAKLAGFFGVDEDRILLTSGTDEAIQVLVNTFVDPREQALILTPSYAMYRFYAEVAGAEIVEVPYREVDLAFDLDAVLAAVTSRTKAILLANPGNPTGTAIPRSDLEAILKAAPSACVLVDEAYFDFYGETMLPRLDIYDNLFVSRTFSKAHGMAALRMGCLMSRPENVASMRKAQSPYSVNMLAAIAASAAVDHTDFTAAYAAEALEGRRCVEAAFQRLGIRFWPSQANFVLFDAGESADRCLSLCRDKGILIRDRRHEIPGALRVTAGPSVQMEGFVDVLGALWGKP